MRKHILYSLLFVFPVIGSAQKIFSETGYITSHPWKILSLSIKFEKSGKYLVVSNGLEPCRPDITTYHFKADGVLQTKSVDDKCKVTEEKGRWKFTDNYTKLVMDMDGTDEAEIFDVVELRETQMTLEKYVKENDSEGWVKVTYQPLKRKGIFITELHAMTQLTTSNHKESISNMGFTPAAHNASLQFYAFKKGTEGELKLYYDATGKFNKITYYTYERLPQNYIWEFDNVDSFYYVSSVQRKPTGSDKYLRTDKHYKDGYVFEASEQYQTFTAYRPITPEDIKDLTRNYPNTKFPELQLTQEKKVDQDKKNDALVGSGPNFCSELAVIIKAFEDRELGKVVDYNKPLGITRSWYESKVTLGGFFDAEGQNLWGYLTYNARLTGSKTAGNEIVYDRLVTQVESCLRNTFNKKTEQMATRFVHKRIDGLSVTVDYSGNDRYIGISITRTSSD